MKRAVCLECKRPELTCICHLFTPTLNQIHVVILQHPTEVNQTKGSVSLLHNSLSSSQVFIGEEFSQNEELTKTLAKFEHVVLLYPSDTANVATEDFFKNIPVQALSSRSFTSQDVRSDAITSSDYTEVSLSKCCLVLLDGTWKKSYKMFMLNAFLQELPHITLPEGINGMYNVRKTKKEGALSSLEACCYALSLLEGCDSDIAVMSDETEFVSQKEQVKGQQPDKYKPLLKAFIEFNNMQLAYRK